MHTPLIPVVPISTSAADVVSMKRTMIEANDTQPPEMPKLPIWTMTARSRKGLNTPTMMANGATTTSLRARYPRGRLPSLASDDRKYGEGKHGQHLVLAERHDTHQEGQRRHHFRARVEPVDGRVLGGQPIKPPELIQPDFDLGQTAR